MTPVAAWHALLRAEVEQAPAYWDEVSGRMRAARLTFGDRVHCPFLRPLFLDEADVARVSRVAEALAPVGERVVEAALGNPALLDAVGLTGAERALVALDPGYARASTASRLDGFLLADSLWFAEYNAESPAGLGYTEVLARLFDELPVMARFKESYTARYFPLMAGILDALARELPRVGRRRVAADGPDRRLPRCAHVVRVRDPRRVLRVTGRADRRGRSA